jgi:heme/copper-type cytochrome/quinol oxidase subunit 4
MARNYIKLEITMGALTVLTGLLYVLRVFGQIESEVVFWGIVAVMLGSAVTFLAINRRENAKLVKIILMFLLALIQLPPILLWFSFNGNSIFDGTASSDFLAHWLFATPHIVIAIIGTIIAITLLKQRKA